jgi:MerR family transcriptional regulator, heat shock protein HspR
MPDKLQSDEPIYVISVAARLVRMHPQTLRYYERAGLVNPTRSGGGIRLYSERDIDRLRKIARLTDSLGVNLAGVEVILRLTERLVQVQNELEKQQIRLSTDYTVEDDLLGPEPAPTTVRAEHNRSAGKPAVKKPARSRRSK